MTTGQWRGPRPAILFWGVGGAGSRLSAWPAPWQLTRVRLQNAATVGEVQRVLDDWDLCHSDDDGVGAHLRRRWSVVAIGDVVKRAGGVIIVTDDG